MNGYERLANEIILLAVKDHRKAMKRLKRDRDNVFVQAVVDETERFFRSDWFMELTDLDGEILIRRLREEAVR